jgi:hypothetical protein
VDLPAVDFGLNTFSGDTVKFVAIEISQTGYSSNEATTTLNSPGGQGYGQTQTLTGVDIFPLVPEPSNLGIVVLAAAVLPALRRRRTSAP